MSCMVCASNATLAAPELVNNIGIYRLSTAAVPLSQAAAYSSVASRPGTTPIPRCKARGECFQDLLDSNIRGSGSRICCR